MSCLGFICDKYEIWNKENKIEKWDTHTLNIVF